jgi:hypothetical protein
MNPQFPDFFRGLPGFDLGEGVRGGAAAASAPNVRVFGSDEERMKHKVQTGMQTIYFWEAKSQTIKELKKACSAFGIDFSSFLEKSDFVSAVSDRVPSACPICFEEFVVGNPVVVTGCAHFGHKSCMQDWAMRNFHDTGGVPKCPVCTSAMLGVPKRIKDVKKSNDRSERKKRKRREGKVDGSSSSEEEDVFRTQAKRRSSGSPGGGCAQQ